MLIASAQTTYAEFKRFSVSAGWLHIKSQGNANSMHINTGVEEGRSARVGDISGDTIRSNIDYSKKDLTGPEQDLITTLTQPFTTYPSLFDRLRDGYHKTYADDPEALRNAITQLTGTAEIYGLSSWNSNAGIEVEDIDTLGLMLDYYVNENVSLQLIGGIPPKVDLKGRGQVYAPFSAVGHPISPDQNLYLKSDILITDLEKYDTAASARAWTPAVEAIYHFGKPGINKFRPYIGAGVMFAHYTDIKLNDGVKNDLVAAGHMIQNIYDGEAGAALEGRTSSGDIRVKTTADDAIAPIISLGFNYDFKPNWYATASVSYAKLNNKTDIKVTNNNTGEQLIHASTKIDVDPLITYVGVGYRF
nr:OmpW family outer membrane protein [Acinetobacter sp. ANC 4779]